MEPLLGDDVEIVLPRPSTVAVGQADPGQLDQIVLNLAVNARDAMAHAGKFIIETGVFDLDEGLLAITP